MAVEIDVAYAGSLHCEATHGPSGRTLVTDAPTDNGGKGETFSPTDLVATALGACLVTIMGLLAERTGLDIDGTRIHVTKEMTSVPLRRIGALKVTVTLPAGRRFSAEDRRKLENAAGTCPVRQSLHPDVNVEMHFVYPD